MFPLCSEASPHKFNKMLFILSKQAFTENWLEVAPTGWKSGNQGAAVQSFCQEIKKCKRVSSSCTSQLFSLFPKTRFHLLYTKYSWSYDREASARIWWQVIVDPVSLGSLEVCGEDADPSLAIGLGGCIPFWDVWPKAALSWLVGGSCDRGTLRQLICISHLFLHMKEKREARVTQHGAEVSRHLSAPTDGALVLPSWDGTASRMIYDDELME